MTEKANILLTQTRDLKRFSGQRSAVSGQRSAVSGQRSAVSGQRSAVSGQRSAVSGQRSAVSGQRSAVSGQRSAVSGQRSAVSGQRSAVSGQRSAVSGQRSAAECAPVTMGVRLASRCRPWANRGCPRTGYDCGCSRVPARSLKNSSYVTHASGPRHVFPGCMEMLSRSFDHPHHGMGEWCVDIISLLYRTGRNRTGRPVWPAGPGTCASPAFPLAFPRGVLRTVCKDSVEWRAPTPVPAPVLAHSSFAPGKPVT